MVEEYKLQTTHAADEQCSNSIVYKAVSGKVQRGRLENTRCVIDTTQVGESTALKIHIWVMVLLSSIFKQEVQFLHNTVCRMNLE